MISVRVVSLDLSRSSYVTGQRPKHLQVPNPNINSSQIDLGRCQSLPIHDCPSLCRNAATNYSVSDKIFVTNLHFHHKMCASDKILATKHIKGVSEMWHKILVADRVLVTKTFLWWKLFFSNKILFSDIVLMTM